MIIQKDLLILPGNRPVVTSACGAGAALEERCGSLPAAEYARATAAQGQRHGTQMCLQATVVLFLRSEKAMIRQALWFLTT